jgi:hypothetical protein
MGYRRTLERRAPAWLVEAIRKRRGKPVAWVEQRLWNGFSVTAIAMLAERIQRRDIHVVSRWRARVALARWYQFHGNADAVGRFPRLARRVGVATAPRTARKLRAFPAPSRIANEVTHFDVVLMSHFSLQGGTTSSNVQEIEAQMRAGLSTGLIHHPVWEWLVTRPVTERISELVDGDRVQWIQPAQRVECDLLVIRAPKIGERLMDDLPQITAKRTVVIVNQTPNYHYANQGATGQAYDLAASYANITRVFGDTTWYSIGPRVRAALEGYHASQLPDGVLAAEDWLNIIDAQAWKREGRRESDGTWRIGRHSRDDAPKWPETPAMLAACYPDDPAFKVSVLGGAEVPREMLGRLPANWDVHGFGALPVRDFLHSLDVYVYFTASTYTEAFGRAPLEALAVGLPTIMSPDFRELFGEAAIYCEPEGVHAELERLRTDAGYYAECSRRASEYVSRHFDFGAHLSRLGAHGVTVPPPGQ